MHRHFAVFTGVFLSIVAVVAEIAMPRNFSLSLMKRENLAAEKTTATISSTSTPVETKAQDILKHCQLELDKITAPLPTKELDALIAENPKNALAYSLRSLCHQRQSNMDKAFADANQAIELDPQLSQGYHARALIRVAQLCYGDLANVPDEVKARSAKEMFSDFDQALALTQSPSTVLVDLAFYHECQRHFSQSLSLLNKAIELDQTLLLAYERRAQLQYTLNLYKGTIDDYTTAARLNPSNREWYLGQIAYAKNNLANAYELQAADQAVRRSPTAKNLLRRGRAYHALWSFNADDVKVACGIADCTRAIELDPTLSEAYSIRAQLSRDSAAAEADYLRAEALDPTDPYLPANTAAHYYRMNMMQKSEEAYKRSARLSQWPSLSFFFDIR